MARIEVTHKGADIRYIVTNLPYGDAEWLYDRLCCARGQAENLIKRHKSQLASDRTSCRSPLANQMGLILHTAAFWLVRTIRDAIPMPQPLASGECSTIRLKLLKVTVRIKETASRVRGRIESVLDWATVRGYRKGDNPARWRGHLESLLPGPSKVRRVEHHAALPYSEIGAFMAELRQQQGVAARAFEFLILTAARTGEAIGARWDEIDMTQALWCIPAGRMKGGKEHRVPLCATASAVLPA